MATVFRRKEWINRQTGQRCGKSDPDAVQRVLPGWFGSFIGDDGLRHKRDFGTDKTEALRLANFFENQAKLRLSGLVDPRADAYKQAEQTAIAAHIDAYESSMKAEGVTPAYAALTAKRMRDIAERAGLEHISALKPAAVSEAIAKMKADGLAARTCSHFLRAAKQFSRWLLKDGRTRDDALVGLKVRVAISRDERAYVRRALTREEFDFLMAHTETAGESYKMSGTDRAWFYRLAGMTGFRSGEVRSLTPAAFFLNDEEPTVTVKAGYSKRGKRSGRDDVQPLPAGAVDALRKWLVGKPKDAPLFIISKWDVAGMLRRDMRRARARWIREATDHQDRRKRRETAFLASPTTSGEVVDYHSFRASYCTWLAMSGAPLKVVQSLARHSTPVLTLNTYVAKPTLGDESRALDALPVPTSDKPIKSKEIQEISLKATGTDDHIQINPFLGTPWGQTSGKLGLCMAPYGEDKTVRYSAENSQNAEENVGFAREMKKADGGSRTRNLRFTKPLLCH